MDSGIGRFMETLMGQGPSCPNVRYLVESIRWESGLSKPCRHQRLALPWRPLAVGMDFEGGVLGMPVYGLWRHKWAQATGDVLLAGPWAKWSCLEPHASRAHVCVGMLALYARTACVLRGPLQDASCAAC